MSEDKNSLSSGDGQDSSVFSLFRRGSSNRFHDDDYSDLPKAMTFKEPPKFHPPKSKFYALYEEEVTKSGGVTTVVIKPITSTPSSQTEYLSSESFIKNLIDGTKVPGEILREKYAGDRKSQRLNQSQPHGSVESDPSSNAAVELFDQAHHSSMLQMASPIRKSRSTPGSPRFENKGLARKLSSSNILQISTMGVAKPLITPTNTTVVTYEKNNQVVEKVSHGVDASTSPSQTKSEDQVDCSMAPSINTSAGNYSFTSSRLGGWLNKKMSIDKRDMNSVFPSST